MRVLILGGAGMLGHKLWQVLSSRFDTWVTVRSSYSAYARYDLFDRAKVLGGVDVSDFDSIIRAVSTVRPDVLVNAVGVIKQLPTAKDPIVSLTINSLLPHRLALLARASNARLVHISTDCVFSGNKGMYTESDIPDPTDLYGRSKLLGETNQEGCVTLRTSIIGRELQTTSGLVEWFLGNKGKTVRGYTNAIYTGFPTLHLAHVIADLIEFHPELSGLYQVSSDPISKYDLLCLVRDAYGIPIDVVPYDGICIDRSLDSTKFRTTIGFKSPPWPELVRAMAADPSPYESWRRENVS
jgi:dTDP-4-dehydrorhamnose reductase